MKRKVCEYAKLPGNARRLFSLVGKTSELYLGEDHLLLLNRTGFNERCQRFDLRDIRAISVCSTFVYGALNKGFGLLVFLTAPSALAATYNGYYWPAGLTGGIAGVSALVLLYNLIKGPTCIVRLHTAVSKEILPSLNRRRKTLKALARLRTAIALLQGELADEALAGHG